MVERSGLVAVKAIRAEAQGTCSRSPVVERRPVAYGKSNFTAMCFSDFCRSFLPERIFQIAARRTVSGTAQGETKSDAVISGDMILVSKHVWSQVAATLRSPLSFPAERTYLSAYVPPTRFDACFENGRRCEDYTEG